MLYKDGLHTFHHYALHELVIIVPNGQYAKTLSAPDGSSKTTAQKGKKKVW